jgi:hypothetical protein
LLEIETNRNRLTVKRFVKGENQKEQFSSLIPHCQLTRRGWQESSNYDLVDVVVLFVFPPQFICRFDQFVRVSPITGQPRVAASLANLGSG